MLHVVRVLVDGASGMEFDYSIPEQLREKVVEGSRVKVPLRNRASTGTVVAIISDNDKGSYKMKPIQGLISEKPILTAGLIELGRWIADYYLAPMESVMRSLIPESVRGENHDFKKLQHVRLIQEPSKEELDQLSRRAPRQGVIIKELKNKRVSIPIS